MAEFDLTVPTKDFDTLGGRLGRAMAAKDITSAGLAAKVGVEVKTLSDWESDRAEPRSNLLARLAGVLGVSPSWLLFGRGASPSEDATPSNVAAIERQLLQLKAMHEKSGALIADLDATLRQASASRAG